LIGVDLDHVHFLVQSVPTYTPKKIVQTIKSITGREVLARVPSVKRQLWGGAFCQLWGGAFCQLWGGAFWSSGYSIDTSIDTVGRHGSEEAIRHGSEEAIRHGSEEAIRRYVAGQGRQGEYRHLHAQPLEPPDQQWEPPDQQWEPPDQQWEPPDQQWELF